MLRFETRDERGCRSYHEVVADGQTQRDRSANCPACGYPLVDQPTADAAAAPAIVPPERKDRAARRGALESAASRLAAQIRTRVSQGTFAIWFAGIVLDDTTSDTVFLAAPPRLVFWLNDRYHPVLAWAAETLSGRSMRVAVNPATPDTAGATTLGDLLAETIETEDLDATGVAA